MTQELQNKISKRNTIHGEKDYIEEQINNLSFEIHKGNQQKDKS